MTACHLRNAICDWLNASCCYSSPVKPFPRKKLQGTRHVVLNNNKNLSLRLMHANGSKAVSMCSHSTSICMEIEKMVFPSFLLKCAPEPMFNWYITNRSESIFFDSIIYGCRRMRYIRSRINTYSLHIWLNFFRLARCSPFFAIPHSQVCGAAYWNQFAALLFRQSERERSHMCIRHAFGAVTCANQSNIKIYTGIENACSKRVSIRIIQMLRCYVAAWHCRQTEYKIWKGSNHITESHSEH